MSNFRVLKQLDLIPSVPYWFAYVRARLFELADYMEHILHYHTTCSDGSFHALLQIIEVQFQAAYSLMSRISHQVPLSQGAIFNENIPSRDDLFDRIYALMQDWERRSQSFHPRVFSGRLSEKARQDVSAMPCESHRILNTSSILGNEVQRRLVLLREHVNRITYSSMRASSSLAHEAHAMLPKPLLALEIPASNLLNRFEESLEILLRRGRERAAHIVQRASKAVHEVEDKLYVAAHELAEGGRKLISYHALPELWRNNDYILTGYRFIPAKNWSRLLISIFHVHNETGNIYTHITGLVLLVVLFQFSGAFDTETTTMDRWIQALYLLAAAKCLTCSVSWHVMAGCADLRLFYCFACIDYTGISWLVAASLETMVYNGFYCQTDLIIVYTIGVFALGFTMSILPWAPWFNDPRYRTVRILLFVFMAFTGLVPFIHGTVLHGFLSMYRFYRPLIPSIASYAIGVLVYGFRFPECLAPGRFDIVGHSHQWWHVAIVLAICFHYRAILNFHENRFAYSCSLKTLPSVLWPYIHKIYKGWIS